jgi:3-oxoacyl-[acyl-carrier protein] reductase
MQPSPMMESPTGTALVTGASRGIGRAIALHLSARWRVIAAARNVAELTSLASEIQSRGGDCEPLVLDVTDAAAVSRALKSRQIDVVVNNAGIGILKPFVELQLDEWKQMIDVNLNAVYHVTHAVLPGMIERGRGHVITIGSIAGKNGFVNGSCYAATKFAVRGFAESLMLEVRDAGVKVSVVMPGSVATFFSKTGRDQSWKLTADDVAATVAFLVDTPPNALIDRVEMRPLKPPKKS